MPPFRSRLLYLPVFLVGTVRYCAVKSESFLIMLIWLPWLSN